MTVGSQYSSVDSWNYFDKRWSGGDGKYELKSDGKPRLNSKGKPIPKRNPYSMTRYEAEADLSKSPFIASCDSLPPGWGVSDDYLHIKALSKLASNVRTHDFHLGKNLVEGKETISMIVEAMRTIGGSIHDLRRLDFSGALRRLGVSNDFRSHLDPRDVAGRWLELQFGWLPIMSQVSEGMVAFAKPYLAPREFSRVVGSSLSRELYDSSLSPTLYSVISEYLRIVHYSYDMVEELPLLQEIGMFDLAGTAWEAVPWSFFVDYFVNVGDFLDALSIIPSLKGKYVKTQIWQVKSGNITALNSRYQNLSCRFHAFKIDRMPGVGLNASNIPFPSFKPLDKALSSAHIKNAVALMTQQMFGGRRKGLEPLDRKWVLSDRQQFSNNPSQWDRI